MANDTPATVFESIRHTTEGGGEYWSARELEKVLDYSGWQRFTAVIAKAQTACKQSGQAVSDHFNATVKMVDLGSGAQREIEDVHLSRFACYLIVQNGDPAKEIIALGQAYFAVQTRRAELADEAQALPIDPSNMTEAQRRLAMRDEVRDRNLDLAATARGAGVVTGRDFGIFQDHGYRTLYGGERARDIAARKGLERGQHILDHMGSTELAANWFRITQTEEKLRRDQIQTKAAANSTHAAVGKKVRQTIADLGGTMPEDLPTPPLSVSELRRREQIAEQKRLAEQLQPSLFPALPEEDDAGDENGGQGE
jgi:DNA-damage-inducible protein D